MNILLVASFALFQATCTLAESIKDEDTRLIEFLRFLDGDGDDAVSLQEVRDKAHEIARQMEQPGLGIADMRQLVLVKVKFTRLAGGETRQLL